ncbi:antibiotic biosynthesis monooxygenase [Herbiconiux sp.]|uniref:putative quinol monooxygenase n=1 Tax=Herbiconiux sp. TaxID=1871186 RepID=UPI0025C190DD|nr:antibiotic biosynthesis monooxygenase [Herbiconiux sp.]
MAATPPPRSATIAKMVFLAVHDDRRDELLTLLEATRRSSAEEPGTLQWELHDDLDGAWSFALYEAFADDEAVAAHDRSTAVEALLAGFAQCLSSPPVAHLLRVR